MSIIELIVEFGSSTRRHGASVYYVTRDSRRRIQREIGSPLFAKIEKKLNAYVVMSDADWVVTTSYRRDRIRTA